MNRAWWRRHSAMYRWLERRKGPAIPIVTPPENIACPPGERHRIGTELWGDGRTFALYCDGTRQELT